MAVLIDPPRWPAHGTRFAHLVSDTDLAELFAFADAAGLPVRGFDHDHYDVPEDRHAELVEAGAIPVPATELVRRLVASGLRLRAAHRTPKPAQVLPALRAAWAAVWPADPQLGERLLARWQEPHRHYHDVRHLWQVLQALAELGGPGARREVALAAWFHDAVHEGSAGRDEERSAELAVTELGALLPAAQVAEVVRLVLLTSRHDPHPEDAAGAALVDADLSVLGQSPGRYHYYSRSVRLEYPQLSDRDFASGRSQVLRDLAGRPQLFHTAAGRARWAGAAGVNLAAELQRWAQFGEQ